MKFIEYNLFSHLNQNESFGKDEAVCIHSKSKWKYFIWGYLDFTVVSPLHFSIIIHHHDCHTRYTLPCIFLFEYRNFKLPILANSACISQWWIPSIWCHLLSARSAARKPHSFFFPGMGVGNSLLYNVF